MPFPSPALTPPTLTDYQLSYGNLNFGGIVQGAAYQLQSLTGIDLPSYLSGDVQRALDQGELPGLDLSPGRDILMTQVVQTDGISLDHARQALGGVLGPAGATEAPLYLKLPSGLFACMARPRRHNLALDSTSLIAGGAVATTLFHATDPRWYAAPTKTASVGLPAAPLGGLTFPVTFPASFGGGGVGGTLQVTNAGLFEMRPVIVFTGPCLNPAVQNISITGSPKLRFITSLNAGDTLTVDTDYQSAVYVANGTTAGSSRRNTLSSTSTWFNLPRGLNQMVFTTDDGTFVAGTMTVKSADAWLAL